MDKKGKNNHKIPKNRGKKLRRRERRGLLDAEEILFAQIGGHGGAGGAAGGGVDA